MTFPGPASLGRGVVIRAGATVPEPWHDATVIRIDGESLADAATVAALADEVHAAWIGRTPVVIEWDAPDDAFAPLETADSPPWSHAASFLFPLERLRFVCFSNNYDDRGGDLTWWWSVKAKRIGATPGGPADVMLDDGTPAWIDGGPRQPLQPMDHPVIHGESVEVGIATTVGPLVASADEELAADQAAAVNHVGGASRIVAPAGSGKTRTLAARLRHLIDDRTIEQEHVVAVAYNARAADELRARVDAGRSVVRTIHSLGWAILGEARPGVGLLGEREVRQLLGALVSVPKRSNSDPMGPYLEALEQVRTGLIDPEIVEGERDDVPGFADIFETYRRRLYETGRVDHGEQVYGAIEALLRDPVLRARWQAKCRHVLVDEFQDLTPAYLLLIRLVASPQLQVFGVGDDDQVIYGYAGADPGFLIDFDTYFPGSLHLALETNYRCPPAVVDAARNLLGYNRRRIEKTIRANRTAGSSDPLVVRQCDGGELATTAAGMIGDWIGDGLAPGRIAVLSRVNSSLIPVKAALVEAGIATNDLLSSESLRRTTLRALFSWLRLARDPEKLDRRDVLEAVRRPGRGLNRAAANARINRFSTLDELADLAADFDDKPAERWIGFCEDMAHVARVGAGRDARKVIRALVHDVGLASSARTLDAGRGNASKSSHLDDLVAVERAAAVHPDLDDFIAWLSDVVGAKPQPDGVTLSSVHRVKGMEWDRVIVFGADRGAMPHDLADDVEEERRVFHVALTRAIEQSVILADEKRPSRFLAELDGSAPATPIAREVTPIPKVRSRPVVVPQMGDVVRVAGGYTGTVVGFDDGRVSVLLDRGAELNVELAEIKEITKGLEPGSEALVEALKAWRRETSIDQGVPAYIVMKDATLAEIAQRRPVTERELLAVAGIGARKLEEYGDDILALVAATE